MRKTHKIVMLSTESISDIALFQTLDYNSQGFDPHIIDTKHLYILSDKNDDIKEGDYAYSKFTNEITKADSETVKHQSNNGCSKVIASTDKSLIGSRGQFNEQFHNIPLIRESFIKKYIQLFNGGNPIEEVQLEWETVRDCEGRNAMCLTDDCLGCLYEQLKVREDNTIIIHQAKFYTRDEVIEIIRTVNNYSKKIGKYLTDKQIDEWKNNNL